MIPKHGVGHNSDTLWRRYKNPGLRHILTYPHFLVKYSHKHHTYGQTTAGLSQLSDSPNPPNYHTPMAFAPVGLISVGCQWTLLPSANSPGHSLHEITYWCQCFFWRGFVSQDCFESGGIQSCLEKNIVLTSFLPLIKDAFSTEFLFQYNWMFTL